MATRAHLREQITSDKIGALTPVAFATVSVFQTGTTTPVTGTLFAAATGAGTLSNPVTADANGVVEFWMTSPQVVDLSIVASGYNSATVTAQVIGASTSTGVVNLNTTTAPAFAGDVQINGESFTYEGTASLHTASTLDQAQTITGAKVFTALQEFSAGVSPDGTHTLTLPAATDTLVGKATTDTLTNKTLSSPAINTPTLTGSGGALTLPAGPDTLVGRATTDTLTNKTITAGKHDVIKDTAGNTVMTLTAGGGVQVGVPTGGDKGTGALNATAVYVNGSVLAPNPYKKLGSGATASNQAITSTASPGTDITSLTVTCTPDGTHDVKITVSLPDVSVASGGGSLFLALQKGGIIVNTLFHSAYASNVHGVVEMTYIDTAPAASSTTYKVSAWLSAAGTLNTIGGDGTTPTNLILVEQIG